MQEAELSFFRRFGDADGEGSVGSSDASAFQAALGSHVGDAGYVSWLDANGDGSIEGTDAALFYANYQAKKGG